MQFALSPGYNSLVLSPGYISQGYISPGYISLLLFPGYIFLLFSISGVQIYNIQSIASFIFIVWLEVVYYDDYDDVPLKGICEPN